ncbi:MAG TPA: serine/threonine-protein kinase [Gemmataceae bacterium]|nr:serine/threonine-protein kinase [Gemmataceae bacterium]
MPADPIQARDLFLHAVGRLPPDAWTAYVAEASAGDPDLEAQVNEYLRVHREAGSFLDRPAAVAADTATFEGEAPTAAGPGEDLGTVIGPYKLVEQIGEGGFGVVYLAEQAAPVRRRVALKVIKPGMDTRQVVARFEAERQALALMDHPNIARVFDGGATPAGRPYFVMELVKGVPITKYCDDQRLSPRDRLGLFVQVCRAVQHAHQKGVIHRDLKPSNVLVAPYDGRPVPKVIDFGVAKAVGQPLTEKTLVTGFGSVIGTPEYMSPEQAELNNHDIDTRSDVYALGILLYELLTGSTPLTRQRVKGAGLLEVLRLVREEEPPRPSTRLSTTEELPNIAANRGLEPRRLSGLVRGELDWIVMKALEKDRDRRYASANGLAMDVQRYLADERVDACPPSAGYRFRKFARRNKAALAAAAGGVLAVSLVVAGLVANNRLIAKEKQNTETALGVAVTEKQRADANLARARKAVRDYLQVTANDPRLKAADLQALRKNLLATAVPFFEEFAALQAGDPEAEGERGQAIFQLAYVREELGEVDKARDEYARARDIFTALAAAHPDNHKYREALAISLYNLGNVLEELNRPADAEAAHREAARVIDGLLAEADTPEFRRHRAAAHINLGALFSRLKKHSAAADEYRAAAAILEALAAAAPADPKYLQELASARGNLANALNEMNDDGALAAYRAAIAAKEKLIELDRTNREYRNGLAMSQNNLGTLLISRGDPAAAEAAYDAARALWAQLATDFQGVPDYRHSLAQSYFNRGNLLKQEDKPVDAIAAYRQAVGLLDGLVRDFPGRPLYRQHLGLNANNLGRLLLDNNEPVQAADAFRAAIAAEERLAADFKDTPGFTVTLAGNYVNLGMALTNGRQPQPALEWFAKAIGKLQPLADRKTPVANARWFLRNAHSNRAYALGALKRYKDAVPDWDRAVELTPEGEREEYRLGRADALVRAGDPDRATADAAAVAEHPGAAAPAVYNAACIFALAAAADKARADRYADRAVELLRQAIAKGYTDVGHIEKDPDFDAVRARPAFVEAVAALKAKKKP